MDLEKVRQQYDFLPYPESDLTLFPTSMEQIYIHSLVTPYYLRWQKLVNLEDKVILDAGCGSGMQALALAVANPEAKIIGVDISEKSITLAQQRFEYHKLPNGEFYAMALEDIASLGCEFDLINCDEVLYLLPDPGKVLKDFASVLAPQGIIRTNLHSAYQRVQYYRIQELFRCVGLYDEPSIEDTLEIVKNTLENLREGLSLKGLYQHYLSTQLQNVSPDLQAKLSDEWLLTNFLLRGDKGYTIPDVFSFLEEADLDFLSMVNWRHWDIADLFGDPDNLPLFWQMGLESASEAEKLHLYELLNPVHRLLDFWCVKKTDSLWPVSPTFWSDAEWDNCDIVIHPTFAHQNIYQTLLDGCQAKQARDFSQFLKLNTKQSIWIDPLSIAVLLPLWKKNQKLLVLLERWLQIQPVKIPEMVPKSLEEARTEIKELLAKLETFGFILLQLP